MNPNKPPHLIIFAGANGCGKTTAAEYLLPRHKIKEFVNADEIARGLSPFNPRDQRVSAGKLMIKRMNSLIKKSESFAIETTLSGITLSNTIKKARSNNYKIEMHYLLTNDPKINIQRIKNRVKEGGHHIPTSDVIRRYWRSIYLLQEKYILLCDKLYLYDLSNEFEDHFAILKTETDGSVFGKADEHKYKNFLELLENAKKRKDKENSDKN